MTIKNSLSQIGSSIRTPTPRYLIGINALALIIYGIWLVHPMDTFGFSELYKYLGIIAPEWAWGVAAIIAGIIKFGGAVIGNKSAVRWASFVGFAFWGLTAALYWAAATEAATPIVIAAMAVQAAGHYLSALYMTDEDK